MMSLMAGTLGACASLDATPPVDGGTGGTGLPPVTVACTNDVTPDISLLDWELGVSADPIKSGEPFTATLDGFAVFGEAFLDAAQDSFPGLGVREVNVVELNATVLVRTGASGSVVVLTLDPTELPYQCERSKTACDPEHDVLGDPPDPPGLRANTDCEPVSVANVCGRFVDLPISMECDPDGTCDKKGKAVTPDSQCEVNGFCVTDGVKLPLQAVPAAQYTASDQEKVLFGWDDQNTGATELEEGGPDDGTWILPPAVYDKPAGPNGIRVTVRGAPVALECTMGVDCMGDLGTGCVSALSSPTPDSALVALPIE